MKRYILTMVLMVGLLTGCSTTKSFFGKSSISEQKQSQKIEQIVSAQSVNQTAVVNQIASLSYGVGFTLDQINQPPKEVAIAKNLNERIISLSGMPSVDEVKRMESTISNLRTNVDQGQRLLAARDKQIQQIQSDKVQLQSSLESEIDKYMSLAQQTARRADTTQVQLDSYKGWFGLKAVFLGLKQFVFTSIWIIVGCLVVFLILRFAAASNPIANAIFTVFEQAVTWIINTIKVLFPKAIQFAGHIPIPVFQSYKTTLTHIVDCAELLKQKNGGASLNDLFTELDKAMDSTDKARVDEIKKELRWK